MYERYRRRRAFERLAQEDVDAIVAANTRTIRGAAWLGVGVGFALAVVGAYEAELVATVVGLVLVATSFADLVILAPTSAPHDAGRSDAGEAPSLVQRARW
jgi:hypothetical protein